MRLTICCQWAGGCNIAWFLSLVLRGSSLNFAPAIDEPPRQKISDYFV